MSYPSSKEITNSRYILYASLTFFTDQRNNLYGSLTFFTSVDLRAPLRLVFTSDGVGVGVGVGVIRELMT